jgi:hypothetical protein
MTTTAEKTRIVRPWRLSGAARKATLVTHVVSGVGWLGANIPLLVLAVVGLTTDDPLTAGACYQAIGLYVTPTVLTAGLTCLASGILLGLGGKYGVLRYWWVAVKLVLNVVLSSLVLLLLRPSVADAAATGREVAAGRLPIDALGPLASNLVFPPAVSLAVLTFATILSVYKPWGRTPRGRRS